MIRILTWHFGPDDQPSFYMEKAYDKTHVRVMSDSAPTNEEAEFDITDDGVSIFGNSSQETSTFAETYSEIHYGVHDGHFTAHETVDGGTSGASGIVVSDDGVGMLLLTDVSVGTDFSADETITGDTSGTEATVNSFVRGNVDETFSQDAAKHVVSLDVGETLNEMGGDFVSGDIEAGSIVTAKCIKRSDATNITLQLELESIDEEVEEDV